MKILKPGFQSRAGGLRCRLFIGALALLLLPVEPSFGQIDTAGTVQKEDDAPERYFSLFEDEDILKVYLHFDLAKFLKKADRDKSIDGRMNLH